MDFENLTPTVCYANFMSPAEREWPNRRLCDYEMILVIDGKFELILHETEERIPQMPGEVMFIYRNEWHTYRACAGEKHIFFSCVHFDLPDDSSVLRQIPRRFPLGRNMGILVERFRRLSEDMAGTGRFHSAISNSILREILLRLWEIGEKAPVRDESRILELTAYIDAHLEQHPGREKIARKFFLSKPYINRLFQVHLGETPTEYLHRRLASKGYELLFYGNRSVKEAAAELGFANQFHFSRVFKQVFGIAPSRLQAEKHFFRPDQPGILQ